VRDKDVLVSVMPLAPIEQQRRIIDILEDHLSRLDVASRAVRVATARLVSLRRASLDQITKRLGGKRVPLSTLVDRIEAGRSFGSASRPATIDEWGIIKVSAMTWGEFRPEQNKVVSDEARIDKRYEIHTNDILVSRANTTEYVGAPVLVGDTRGRLLLSDKSLRLIPRDGVSTAYLHRVLSAPDARRQLSERATGTKDSMRNISQASLLTIQVPTATADGQASVVAAVTELDDAAVRLDGLLLHALGRSAMLRHALLEAAFSGRLTGTTPAAGTLEEFAGV